MIESDITETLHRPLNAILLGFILVFLIHCSLYFSFTHDLERM